MSFRPFILDSSSRALIILLFFFNDTATTEIYTLSLHDALPILLRWTVTYRVADMPERSSTPSAGSPAEGVDRSEEHTSELQSRQYLVCRLLLEKKKKPTESHDSGRTCDTLRGDHPILAPDEHVA